MDRQAGRQPANIPFAGRRHSGGGVRSFASNDTPRFMAALLLAVATCGVPACAQIASGAAAGIPFGPWRLPDSLFRAPFTGTVLALHPGDATARLDAARRAHMRVFIILERSRRNHQNADKSFSLAQWKNEIRAFSGVDFAPYVADGTVIGHMLIDEPHDPTNWNGAPIPFATIDSAAAFSKELWPTLPTGVTSPPTFLGDGSLRSLDWSYAQYRPNKGDLGTWLASQAEAARRSGLGFVLSINVREGNGRGAPLTADQLRRFGLAMAAESDACALTMWKFDAEDSDYFQRPDIQAAVGAIAAAAAAHPSRSCSRR
jgi:hypothetical protein